MTGSADYKIDEHAKPYLDSYQDYSKRLRTWLIAYGIGAPILFVSQVAFSKMLHKAEISKPIILTFLVGVCVQVCVAFSYKAVMWYVFRGLVEKQFQRTVRYRVSDWISEQLWLEMALDGVTIVAFVWATWKVLSQFNDIAGLA